MQVPIPGPFGQTSGQLIGSAFISGWYGQLKKDLRTILGLPVEGRFSQVYCGNGDLTACRTALTESLQAAIDKLGDSPSKATFDESIDNIDKLSARPNFAITLYSGYLKAKDKDELSTGLSVPPGTPPADASTTRLQ